LAVIAMPSATCRLCHKDAQFPDRWLLYPACGHAFCESCTKGPVAECPTCHASTLCRPLFRILGVQVNEAQLAEKQRPLKNLEELQTRWESKIQAMQVEVADARDVVQRLQIQIMFRESRRAQESAAQVGGSPPGAASAPKGPKTIALQHSLINWDEARRLWTHLKDEAIVLTPTLQASGVCGFLLTSIHTMAVQAECCVCLEDVHFPEKWLVFPTCGHDFCEDCAIRSATACPTCRARRVDQPQTLLRLFNIRLRMPQVASNDEPLRLRVENARLMRETGRLIDELDDAQRRLHGRPAMFYQHAWGTMKIVDAFENIAEDKKVTEAKSIMLCLTMLTAECPVCIESFEFPKDGAFFPACGEVSPRPPVLQLTGDAEDLASAAGSLGSGSLRSIDPSRVDSVEDYADAEAEKACNALQSLSEWSSLDHDDAAKIVIRDAYVAVQHFRTAHLRLLNHHHRVRADHDLRGERMAALERDNKRLSDLRELSGTMLRASEEIQRRKENELVVCRNALKEAKDKVTTLTPKLSRLEREKLERDGDYAKLEAYVKVLT
ncbi:hypothetical protein GGF50DRAFT_16526, partial [Schizophyllum commune]